MAVRAERADQQELPRAGLARELRDGERVGIVDAAEGFLRPGLPEGGAERADLADIAVGGEQTHDLPSHQPGRAGDERYTRRPSSSAHVEITLSSSSSAPRAE